jgi:hypothetical protein
MIRTGRKKEWSILLFVVCFVSLMPPVISLFDIPLLVFDIRLIFLFIFGVWAFAIAMTAVGARRGPEKSIGPPEAERGIANAADSVRGKQ